MAAAVSSELDDYNGDASDPRYQKWSESDGKGKQNCGGKGHHPQPVRAADDRSPTTSPAAAEMEGMEILQRASEYFGALTSPFSSQRRAKYSPVTVRTTAGVVVRGVLVLQLLQAKGKAPAAVRRPQKGVGAGAAALRIGRQSGRRTGSNARKLSRRSWQRSDKGSGRSDGRLVVQGQRVRVQARHRVGAAPLAAGRVPVARRR